MDSFLPVPERLGLTVSRHLSHGITLSAVLNGRGAHRQANAISDYHMRKELLLAALQDRLPSGSRSSAATFADVQPNFWQVKQHPLHIRRRKGRAPVFSQP